MKVKVIITFLLFMITLAAVLKTGGCRNISDDIVVDEYQVKIIRDARIKLTGSIILKRGAVLYISYSTLDFIGEKWRNKIEIERGAYLKIIESSVSSLNEIYFSGVEAKVCINNSNINLKGLMEGNFTIEVYDSEFSITTISAKGNMSVSHSRLKMNGCFEGSIYAENSYIDGDVYLKGRAYIYCGDIKTALGEKWFIYRSLCIRVLDRYYMPVDGAFITVTNFFNGSAQYTSTTDCNGFANFILLSDYISNTHHFLGVYNISVNYRGRIYFKTDSLPYYVSGKMSEAYKFINLSIDAVAIPTPKNNDYIISGNIYRISNGSYHYKKSIFLFDNATLFIDNAEISMSDNCYIVLKNRSKLIVNNSLLNAIIYLENSRANIISSKINSNVYLAESSVLKCNESELIGIYGKGLVILINTYVNSVHTDTMEVIGGNLKRVWVENLSATNCNIDHIFISRAAYLYSVSYDKLNFSTSATIFLNYRVEIEVLDKRRRPVENAVVTIYSANGIEFVDSKKSNEDGLVQFYLYSSKYYNSRWEYNGNYIVVIAYRNISVERHIFVSKDLYISIRFDEYLVPPLYLFLDVYIPSQIESGKEILIRGRAYYETGRLASNVSILITIGESVIYTSTQIDGTFSMKLPINLAPGKYKIIVAANDTYHDNLTATKILNIEVRASPYPTIYFGIGTLIAVILFARYYSKKVRVKRLMEHGEELYE